MWCVVVVSPAEDGEEGLNKVVGPFDQAVDAASWCTDYQGRNHTVVVRMTPPTRKEDK